MSIRAKNRKPVHPGAILREDVLPSLGITQTELADKLRVSRRTVSQIIHEQRPLTVDMAIRLGRYLGTSPESWLNMQLALDVWVLKNKNAQTYDKIKQAA